MKRAAMTLALSAVFACAAISPAACSPATSPRSARSASAVADPLVYLRRSLVPWPSPQAAGRLALTDPGAKRVAAYDSALMVLVLIRRGSREEAASVIEALLALQRSDGSVPFSFVLPRPDDTVPYVRSGAVAWVGYAATEYLDAAAAGPARTEALALARAAARYLIGRQVSKDGDPRDGLVRGGTGILRYEADERGGVRERLEPGEIEWTSTEHNVDAFFFLRALARVTGDEKYAVTAARIARGLQRAWDPARGQLARGMSEAGPDVVPALDCASWGSIFLGATGDRERAGTAASVADSGYAARDRRTGAHGHRMQSHGPVMEGEVLMRVLGPRLPASDWAQLDAVWPEGSAGVALAAWRAGRAERAHAILDSLEPLRGRDGSLPTATIEVPFLFDTRPSVAGTAWVELVRFELRRAPDHPTFWVP
jgi:hypothetical protein